MQSQHNIKYYSTLRKKTNININRKNNIFKKIHLVETSDLNKKEIEENLGEIIKSTNIKNDISVCLNQASSLEILALKVKRNHNHSLEIVIPSIEESSYSNTPLTKSALDFLL